MHSVQSLQFLPKKKKYLELTLLVTTAEWVSSSIVLMSPLRAVLMPHASGTMDRSKVITENLYAIMVFVVCIVVKLKGPSFYDKKQKAIFDEDLPSMMFFRETLKGNYLGLIY